MYRDCIRHVSKENAVPELEISSSGVQNVILNVQLEISPNLSLTNLQCFQIREFWIWYTAVSVALRI